MSVLKAYASLRLEAGVERQRFLKEWTLECAVDWHDEARSVLERVRAADSRPETVAALCRFVVSGVAGAIDQGGWSEAKGFLQQLTELDAGTVAANLLSDAIDNRSEIALGGTLDGAVDGDLEEFFSLLLALGASGIPLALAALRGARHSRTRAAACTALAYLCADSPRRLERALRTGSPEIVVHAVSVLGHIGGHE